MEARVAHTPANCPECRSQDLVTTSKTSDDEAYWRCRKCGEVWNVKRMEENQHRRPYSFNRNR